MHQDLEELRDALRPESYDTMAVWLNLESRDFIAVAGNTVRRWFCEDRMPLYPLLLLLEHAQLPLTVAFKIHPWARRYFKQELINDES